jgi:hypothetical protein
MLSNANIRGNKLCQEFKTLLCISICDLQYMDAIIKVNELQLFCHITVAYTECSFNFY